jgi:hypothetical protein
MTTRHARPNAVGMVGEYAPTGGRYICPRCGGLKSENGVLCESCQKRQAAAGQAERAREKRIAIRRERQPRFDAALALGWTLEELYRFRRWPGDDPLPTWEEIIERDPAAFIRWWYRRSS